MMQSEKYKTTAEVLKEEISFVFHMLWLEVPLALRVHKQRQA